MRKDFRLLARLCARYNVRADRDYNNILYFSEDRDAVNFALRRACGLEFSIGNERRDIPEKKNFSFIRSFVPSVGGIMGFVDRRGHYTLIVSEIYLTNF